MAAKKYLRMLAGRIVELAATVVSAGAGNDGDLVALDGTGRLDLTVMPVGIVPDTKQIQASEALSAGNLVNVWNSGGNLRVRKADGTTSGKEADGFILAGVSNGANASVYFEGINTQLSGLTPGSRYYLDTTAGAITETAPSGSGNVVQYIGKAISATELDFEPSDGVVLA